LRSNSTTAAVFSSCARIRACNVRTPRRHRKLSNGAPVTPITFAHQPKRSASSAVEAMTAPPTTSLCPFKYLVVECITTSAPRESGCCHTGDRNVLSATTKAP
jgi:hypothetical protein